MQSQFRAREVRAKTNEVLEYHRDDQKPGKPLSLLIPGGLIALAALALIVYIAYRVWLVGDFDQSAGVTLTLALSPFYIGGVFLFSYGYELYNIPRALRLTAIIVFITLASVVIVAVLFALAGNLSGGNSSSRSKSGSGSSHTISKTTSNSAPSNSGYNSGAFPVILGGFGGGTNTVQTREVTKEVVKEVPKEPMPIKCPFCGTSYTPAENKFICPNCGAATPKELIEESQMPNNSGT